MIGPLESLHTQAFDRLTINHQELMKQFSRLTPNDRHRFVWALLGALEPIVATDDFQNACDAAAKSLEVV